MSRAVSIAIGSVLLPLFVYGGVAFIFGPEPVHLAEIHRGWRYYDVDQWSGSLYFTSTLQQGLLLSDWDGLNDFYMGFRQRSSYSQATVVAIPYWPLFVCLAIFYVWREKHLPAAEKTVWRRRLRVFGLMFAYVALYIVGRMTFDGHDDWS